MGVSETVTSSFLDIVNKLSPDIDSIYESAKGNALDDWKLKQRALVTASGAAAMAIPGLHMVGIVADVAFVLNRMSVATYGTGAILGERAGLGNIVEQEDFAAVLGYWSDDEDIQQAMQGKGSATLGKVGAKVGTKLAGKAFAKGVTKAMLTSSGYLIGQRIGGKAMAKAGAKFAGKFAGKAAAGFVPFFGPMVSGGVNLWLISGIIDGSERFYRDKIALLQR